MERFIRRTLIVGRVLVSALLFFMAVDTSEAAPTRIVAAVFLIGWGLDFRANAIYEKLERKMILEMDRHEANAKQLLRMEMLMNQIESVLQRGPTSEYLKALLSRKTEQS